LEDKNMPEEKKNFFSQALDNLTGKAAKDKAEAEAAAQAAKAAVDAAMAKSEAEAKARVAAAAKAAADAKAIADAKAAADARAAAAARDAALRAEQDRQEQFKMQQEKAAESARVAAENAAKAARAALPHRVVGQDETLSAIALKVYGHATEPYWRLIYEANKEAIGANPNVVRPGTEIVIPVLPDELKK